MTDNPPRQTCESCGEGVHPDVDGEYCYSCTNYLTDADRFLRQRARTLLEAKGVRLNIHGCGCCGSPTVKLWIDDELIADEEEGFQLTMIGAS